MNYSKTSWTANSTQTIKLPRHLTLELSGNYEAPKAINAFGNTLERWQVNTGLSKKRWACKGVLKIATTDLFWTYRWGGKSVISNTEVQFWGTWDNRITTLYFTYKFGNKVAITQDIKS